jgi:hypothetical protein
VALTPEEVSRLEERARHVGDAIGWHLKFHVAPNPEYVGVTAGADMIFIIGPDKLSDLAAYDIDLALDALERGDRVIIADDDGDPRLSTRVEPDVETAMVGPAISADQPLDLQRTLDLVDDAMQASMLGDHPDVAAARIVEARRPTLREVAAAREQNQEVNSGLTPEPLRSLMPPSPVPEEIVRLRRAIDDVLVAAERQLAGGQPGS